MKHFMLLTISAVITLFLILPAAPQAWGQNTSPAQGVTGTPSGQPTEQAPAVNQAQNPETGGEGAVQAEDLPAPAPVNNFEPTPANSNSTANEWLLNLSSSPYFNAYNIGIIVGAFILVMLLLYLLLKGRGRAGRFKNPQCQDSPFQMRGILPVSSNQYLAAVEIEGRLLVVGVSPDRLTALSDHPLDMDDDDDAFNLGAANPTPRSSDLAEKNFALLDDEPDLPLDISIIGEEMKHK